MELKYTFLQALASTTKDPKVLRDQIVAILLAGRDTTAAALSWTMYELARHPAVFQKLRAEIIDTIGLENPPTYRNLKDMKYLQVSPSDFRSVCVELRRFIAIMQWNSKSRGETDLSDRARSMKLCGSIHPYRSIFALRYAILLYPGAGEFPASSQ